MSYDTDPHGMYAVPVFPGRPWWRRARVLAPAGVALGFAVGSGLSHASVPVTTVATATPSTVTHTATVTGHPATVTRTLPPKKPTTKVVHVDASDPAVQAVLNAYQNYGPEPAKQVAAIKRLRKEWPTLANALDAATAASPATTAPTDVPTDIPTTDVYYSNCSEARAAGAAPIFAGQPGYRAGLDRDGDGVACE